MARQKSPAFQWYPKDCETDEVVMFMTLEEFGAYVRLLNHQWLNGSVPSDPHHLAVILRTSTDVVERIWPTVSSKFPALGSDDSRVANPRLERERKNQRLRSKKRKAAADERWKKQRKAKHRKAKIPDSSALQMHSKSNANAVQKQCSASASATASADNPPSPPSRPSPARKTPATDEATDLQDLAQHIVNVTGNLAGWDEGFPIRKAEDWADAILDPECGGMKLAEAKPAVERLFAKLADEKKGSAYGWTIIRQGGLRGYVADGRREEAALGANSHKQAEHSDEELAALLPAWKLIEKQRKQLGRSWFIQANEVTKAAFEECGLTYEPERHDTMLAAITANELIGASGQGDEGA